MDELPSRGGGGSEDSCKSLYAKEPGFARALISNLACIRTIDLNSLTQLR